MQIQRFRPNPRDSITGANLARVKRHADDAENAEDDAAALWLRRATNRDASTGLLACPFACSLSPLTHLLAPHSSLRALHCAHLLSHNDLVWAQSAPLSPPKTTFCLLSSFCFPLCQHSTSPAVSLIISRSLARLKPSLSV